MGPQNLKVAFEQILKYLYVAFSEYWAILDTYVSL